MATSGDLTWPPVGTFPWPWTHRPGLDRSFYAEMTQLNPCQGNHYQWPKSGTSQTTLGHDRPVNPTAKKGGARGQPVREANGLPLWLRLAAPALVLLAASMKSLGPVKDPDTFWHIASGDWLRQSWQFSGPDPWSTASTRPWTLHEWLPQLLLSWVEQHYGLAGVAWLLPAGVAAVMLSVLCACRQGASLLVSGVITALAFLAMAGSVSVRPQIVTFALTALFVSAWLRTKQDQKARWWLIPLTWIWACSHGMWFIGVVVGVAALAGIVIGRNCTRETFMRLAVVPAGSVVAAALTPSGPRLLLAPLEVGGYTKYVTEWAPPTLSDPQFLSFLVLVAIPVIIWARRERKTSWTYLLLLGVGLAVGLAYSRTVAVGAAITAPLAAQALQTVTDRPVEAVTRAERLLMAASVTLALTITAGLAPSVASSPSGVPNALNAPLDALPDGTVLCNDYRVGGWLIWRHRDLHPTIDGRTEIYTPDHVRGFVAFYGAAPGWQRYVKESECSYALLASGAPGVEALKVQLAWQEVAAGDGYTLLRPGDASP